MSTIYTAVCEILSDARLIQDDDYIEIGLKVVVMVTAWVVATICK